MTITGNTSPSPVLRFVHVSDIHVGQETGGNADLLEDIRDQIVLDCKKLRADKKIAGPASAIWICGDIAYSGKEKQYIRAEEWIDQVADAAGCGSRDVRMVPGNHDVDLSKITAACNALQEHLRALPVD